MDPQTGRTSATDQLGKVTLFTYDVLDKLSSVTDPLTNSWAYTYDPNYNLSTVTNPRGATTSYTYSANDRLEATTDALGHTWAFTHDAAGNTLSSSYPTGETVSRTYTADDLLAHSAYSSGESYAVSYAPAHRLSGVTGTGGTLSFTYSPVGRLLSATDTADGQSFATTYAYDPWGTLLSENESVANPYRFASYRYDEATGLSYCWNRYYAPELARFLTRDIYPGELADPATMNPYLYCGGDSVNAVDPSGMLWSGVSLASGVAAAALGTAAFGAALRPWAVAAGATSRYIGVVSTVASAAEAVARQRRRGCKAGGEGF